MFEEISTAMKYGLFQQAAQIGKDWENHFKNKAIQNENMMLENFIQTYNSIMENFNNSFCDRMNEFYKEEKEKEDVQYSTRKMEKCYSDLKNKYENTYNKYQQLLKNEDTKKDKKIKVDEALKQINILNKCIQHVNDRTLEISRKSSIYYRDLSYLELDVFYMKAATYADGLVRDFLNDVILKKLKIENIDDYVINVFATAYEDYVLKNSMDRDPQWKTRMSVAMDERKEADEVVENTFKM